MRSAGEIAAIRPSVGTTWSGDQGGWKNALIVRAEWSLCGQRQTHPAHTRGADSFEIRAGCGLLAVSEKYHYFAGFFSGENLHFQPAGNRCSNPQFIKGDGCGRLGS